MGLLDYIKANTPRATTPRVKPGTVIREGLLSPNQFNAPAANRFKNSLFGLAGVVPGVGDVASGVEAADLWNRGEKVNAGLTALGMLPFVPALGGMIAYHGSPHRFNKFDPSYIGSSQEGKLFGGRGFSFADNPRDAKLYGENLYKVDLPDDAILDARNKEIFPQVFGDVTPRGANKPLREIVNEYESAKKATKIEDVYVKDLENGWKEIQWKVNGEWKSPINNRISSLELSDDPTGLFYALRHELPTDPSHYFSTTAFNPNDVTDAVQKYGKSAVMINGSIGHLGDEITAFDPAMMRILEINGQPTGLLSWADEAKKYNTK